MCVYLCIVHLIMVCRVCISEKDDEMVSLPDSSMDCLRGCSAILSVLVVRISLLKYSKIHEKPYKFIVCEFGGF